MLLITAARRGSSAVVVVVVVLGWVCCGGGRRSDDDLPALLKLKKKPFFSSSCRGGRWPWLDLRRLRSGCCGRVVVELSPGWVIEVVMGGKGAWSSEGSCCSSAMC